MKKVFSSDREADIAFIVGLLDSNGITTQVRAEGAGDYLNIMGVKTGIMQDVYVHAFDYDTAIKLIKENSIKNKRQYNIQDRIVAIVIVVIILLIILFSVYDTIRH